MSYKDLLIFDISSEYGHFRKFNTTTSPLTYSVPTRPAIAGLVGAIVGIEREVGHGKFKKGSPKLPELLSKENAAIAVQLLSPVKKSNVAFNLVSTKNFNDYYNVNKRKKDGTIDNSYRRTQIEFELLKLPKFRVFIAWNSELYFNTLVENLKNNRSHFTPYLGLSQFTAHTEFVGITRAEILKVDNHENVVTAINLSLAQSNDPVVFDYDHGRYILETMPVEIGTDRIVTEFSEVLIETEGKPIRAKLNEMYKTLDYGVITFL